MNDAILVNIGGESFVYDESSPRTFVIKETDYLSLSVRAAACHPAVPVVRFEDYETQFELVEQSGEQIYQTTVRTYLSECFGKVVVRLYLGELVVPIVFDVLAKKTSAEQALKMIKYLADVSPLLVKACLARSSTPFGNAPAEEIEPEALLTVAEGLISVLQSTRQELIATIRERLVPKILPLRSTNKLTCEVDPVEVLSNLDALTPATGIGDVCLRGRNFDLSDIDVSAVQPTADVRENHILLGGLYSIQRRLLALANQLSEFSTSNNQNTPTGYESFARLLLSVTAEGMINRCSASLEAIEGLIDLFERKLGVKYMGELVPVMTPFVRSTRVYRALFAQLAEWYSLGAPAIGKIQFMLKMKSLSKIYELFTFYHVFDEFSKNGWAVIDSLSHPEYGDFMAHTVVFSKDAEKITIQYEPIIEKLSKNTRHGDLIDVAHRHTAERPYWTPDFVLRWERGDELRYIILDAKYSTANSVRQYAIPALYSKYYEGTAVFDARNGLASSSNIIAVIAVYALEWNNPNYLSKWDYQGIFSNVPRIPAIGGMGLMTDNDVLFRRCLNRILELTRIVAHTNSIVESSSLDAS